MCLNRVCKTYKPVRFGYVVMRRGEKSFSPWRTIYTWYRKGLWYKSKPGWDPDVSKRMFGYVLGFHVWHSYASAVKWQYPRGGYVIVAVEVDDIECVGRQFSGRVTVAHQRRILGVVTSAKKARALFSKARKTE